MFRALSRGFPGFGYEAFLDLTIPEFGGLLGMDEVPFDEDPDFVQAQAELAKKRGPSPDRRG